MNYLEGTEQLKKLLKEQSDMVVPNLQDIVKKLIGFVQEGTIFSFEFYGNMSNGEKPDKIVIFLTPTKAHRKINLGAEVSNLDFFEKSINEQTMKELKDIQEYLLFLNNHLTQAIPEIRRSTKFRDESERKIESDQPRLPNFAKNVLKA